MTNQPEALDQIRSRSFSSLRWCAVTAALLLLTIGGAAMAPAVNVVGPWPGEAIAQAARERAYLKMEELGRSSVGHGMAIDFAFSPDRRLDLTIGSSLVSDAQVTAQDVCRSHRDLPRGWEIRIFLNEGQRLPAAWCYT